MHANLVNPQGRKTLNSILLGEASFWASSRQLAESAPSFSAAGAWPAQLDWWQRESDTMWQRMRAFAPTCVDASEVKAVGAFVLTAFHHYFVFLLLNKACGPSILHSSWDVQNLSNLTSWLTVSGNLKWLCTKVEWRGTKDIRNDRCWFVQLHNAAGVLILTCSRQWQETGKEDEVWLYDPTAWAKFSAFPATSSFFAFMNYSDARPLRVFLRIPIFAMMTGRRSYSEKSILRRILPNWNQGDKKT